MKALRLSVGLLTIIPVGAIDGVDRRTARRAILLAPAVGALVALLGAVVLLGVHALAPSTLGALVAAVLAIATTSYLTRALHLDGLADTADALGSGKPALDALEIARRGDVGPFGVVTIVLVLLTQVAALALATTSGFGAAALVIAVVTGRVAIVMACMRGIPAARPDGLGVLVAGTIPRSAALGGAIAWITIAVLANTWLTGPSPATGWIVGSAAVVGALVLARVVVVRAARRLGGITGDVLGAAAEVAATAALVILAVGATVGA